MDSGKVKIIKKTAAGFVVFLLIPLTVALGVWLFKDRKYNIISAIVAFLSCVPFLYGLKRA